MLNDFPANELICPTCLGFDIRDMTDAEAEEAGMKTVGDAGTGPIMTCHGCGETGSEAHFTQATPVTK